MIQLGYCKFKKQYSKIDSLYLIYVGNTIDTQNPMELHKVSNSIDTSSVLPRNILRHVEVHAALSIHIIYMYSETSLIRTSDIQFPRLPQ